MLALNKCRSDVHIEQRGPPVQNESIFTFLLSAQNKVRHYMPQKRQRREEKTLNRIKFGRFTLLSVNEPYLLRLPEESG